MKKIICLLGLFLFACGNIFADNLSHQDGEWNAGLSIKTSTPGLGTDWGEFNMEDETSHICHDAKPGTTSIGYDLQVLYFITDRVALGVSVGDE